MYNDNVFRDESGNYSVNGMLISRQEANSLYDYMQLEYFKEDLRQFLEEDNLEILHSSEDGTVVSQRKVNNVLSHSGLVKQLYKEFEDSMSNSEQWLYSLEETVMFNKESIQRAANDEPKEHADTRELYYDWLAHIAALEEEARKNPQPTELEKSLQKFEALIAEIRKQNEINEQNRKVQKELEEEREKKAAKKKDKGRDMEL